MIVLILKNLAGGGSGILVSTEQLQDKIVELRVLELSPHGTLDSSPVEDVPLVPEEVLPVVGDVGEDSPEAPHVGRGGDVRVLPLEDLRGEVADGAPVRVGVVVHGGGSLT